MRVPLSEWFHPDRVACDQPLSSPACMQSLPRSGGRRTSRLHIPLAVGVKQAHPFPVGFVQFSYSLVVQQMTMPMRAGTCLLFQSRRPIRLCNSFPQAKGYPIRFWLPSDETDGEWIASWPHLFADPWSAYLSRAIGGTCLFSAVLHPHPVLGILQLRLSYSRCTSYGIPLLRLPS